MRAFVFGAIGMIFMSSPLYAKCHVDYSRIYFDGATSSSAGAVDSGKNFSIHLSGGMTSVEITRQAQHGTVEWNGSLANDRVIYKSTAGYKGADSFTIAIHGLARLRGLA